MEGLAPDQQAELAAIHRALERIERGIFGKCQGCLTPLDPEMLAAKPWRSTCAECEERAARDSQQAEGPRPHLS
jgi:RNA polymerase-binding transcription factor DksA